MTADRFHLASDLCARQRYEKSGVAEIAVVFRNFIFEHEVITEGVVSELGNQR